LFPVCRGLAALVVLPMRCRRLPGAWRSQGQLFRSAPHLAAEALRHPAGN